MSESKFTKGPWEWFAELQIKFLKSSSTGQGFAHTAGLTEPTDTANANLIAAAPDLYESLTETRNALAAACRIIVANEITDEFLTETYACGLKDGVGVRADAALAKARGEK
jgi:hypothetical protein